MRNNLTPTIGERGNEEEQQIQTINTNTKMDNRSEMMRLMLTMTATSIRQLPYVYLPTGICYL